MKDQVAKLSGWLTMLFSTHADTLTKETRFVQRERGLLGIIGFSFRFVAVCWLPAQSGCGKETQTATKLSWHQSLKCVRKQIETLKPKRLQEEDGKAVLEKLVKRLNRLNPRPKRKKKPSTIELLEQPELALNEIPMGRQPHIRRSS